MPSRHFVWLVLLILLPFDARLSAAQLPDPSARILDNDRHGNTGESRLQAGSKNSQATLGITNQQKHVRVACVGDSITYGYGLDERQKNSYPAQLQQLLGDQFKVGNFGLSGSGVLKNAKRAGTDWHRCYAQHTEYLDSIAFKPDLVVINLGINDVVHWNELGDQFVDDYVDVIQAYKSLPNHPQILIWHRLTPLFHGQKFFGDPNVERLHAAIATAAERTGVKTIDLDAPLVEHPEWFPDRLHPNAEGAKRIAKVVAEAIAPNQFLQAENRKSENSNTVAASKKASSSFCVTGFEDSPAGPIRKLSNAVGQWEAEEGHATIHAQNAYRGKHSLRIQGGQERIIEFTPQVDLARFRNLSFWAERWTRNVPFTFRIEKLSGGKWSEIYNGDASVKSGGFLTKVSIDVTDPMSTRFRLRVTSPPKTGMLIDDVSFAEKEPMSVNGIVADQPQLPALVGNPTNPVSRIRIDVEGNSGQRPTVNSLAIHTRGTTELADIEKAEIFYTGTVPIPQAWDDPDTFAGAPRFGQAKIPSESLTFKGHQELQPGPNYFWVSYTLQPNANIDHVVDAACNLVVFDDGTNIVPEDSNPESAQRLGVAVRNRGDDGVHTYRIPGLATTNQGTLIGVYDIRHRQGGDLPGDIDVGMSRSTDGGKTWEPMQVIMDMGSDPKWNYDGVGDPSVLVDRQTNTIWVAGIWSHGNRGWHGSGPGMQPEVTGQWTLVRSDDDGQTWSEAINITAQIKQPEMCFLLQGPGKGISMQDGTLVFPAQFQDSIENKRIPRSTIVFSRDHGKTWERGTGAFDDTTEAQVVEIEPGTLMLNCRYNRGQYRVVMITRDMGRTWQEHSTSRKVLLEPGACMASLINVDRERGRPFSGRLLFSNPNSPGRRQRLTIKMSRSNGDTWPESEQLLLDSGASAGYSCMSMIDDETVGILYEGSQSHMTFQRIKLNDISD